MIIYFLYPLCWLGALAVAAPLWLHLRRRSDRAVVRFAAARFLDEQVLVDERPLRLRDPLLFALRAAALALLVAAFAWPYFRDQAPSPIRMSRVLLLDNTLSHQAEGRFTAARDAAVKTLDSAPPDTQIAVVEIGRTPRVIVDFEDSSAEAAAKLAALAPGFDRGSYQAAFRQAAALLEMARGTQRQIELLGDNQENQWTEAEPALPFLDDVEVQLPAAAPPPSANLAVATPELRRSVQAGTPIAELQFQVIRSGDVPAALAIVESNGKVVVERPVLFASPEATTTTLRVAWPADESQEIRGMVRVRRLSVPPVPIAPSPQPATSDPAISDRASSSPTSSAPTISAAASSAPTPSQPTSAASKPVDGVSPPRPNAETGIPKVDLAILADDDALPLDDVAWFHEPPREEGRVALVARSPYLAAALSPEVMRGRWSASATPAATLAERTADSLRTSDVLLIEASYGLEPAGRELIEHYTREGRGVMLVVERESLAIANYLRPLGIELSGEVTESKPAPFRYVMFDHPIFQPLRSRDFGDLLDIRVLRYRRLAAPNARVLVYSSMGDPLVLEIDGGAGRMIVVAFGWERNTTNWPIHPSFVPFLDLCLEYLRETVAWRRQFEPNERCLWPLANALEPPTVPNRIPSGASVASVLADGTSSTPTGPVVVKDAAGEERYRGPLRERMVDFPVPSAPGLYDVSFDGGRSVARTIAVNPSPLEAELAYNSGESKIASWRLASSETRRVENADTATTGPRDPLELSGILRQSTWWWLLAISGALLVLETLWTTWSGAASVARRSLKGSSNPGRERAFL